MATLEDPEARVLAAVNALADFRQEAQGRFRSLDDHLAEIKDLIIGRRNGL